MYLDLHIVGVFHRVYPAAGHDVCSSRQLVLVHLVEDFHALQEIELFSDSYVTVLTGRGPRCKCFCRVVPRKGQRLKDLEHFLAIMRARYPNLQVRSDHEEALKHVLKDACEKVHLEYSNTRLETPASNGRGENSVRTMKEMIQRQKDAVFSLGIVFSIKHPLFALLVRHSEWILNHLVRNDFLVELDNRVIKTSPYESHTGNPALRSTFTSQSYPGRST